MKQKLLTIKSLLVAALLLGGANFAWADMEWQLAWADYFEDASNYTTNISWSSTSNLTISQATRPDGVSGKYYYVYDASANGRTWTYTIGNAYTASETDWAKYTFSNSEAYKLEFDIAFRSDRYNNNYGNDQTFTIPNLVSMTLPKATTTATFKAINAYAAGSIAANDELFTISAAYDYSNTGNVFGNHFYHFVVEGRSTGTTLTVFGPYSEGAYSNTPVYNAKLSDSKIDVASLTGVVQRYYSSMGLDNVLLYKEVEAGTVEVPTASITAVDGINRTVTFACATDGVTFSYSTDDGANWTTADYVVISANTDIIVKATKNAKSAQSATLSFQAGSAVPLNEPTASVTALTLNADGLYYPTVSGNYDPAGVLLSPTATLTAKFNGSAISLPYVATTAGTLTITASYEGYEATDYNYDVVGYAKVLWKDYTETTTPGRPSGVRKWSDDGHWELAEGYGFKAIRDGGNAWAQIDKAGMIAYDKLSEASNGAITTTVIVVANDNTGNNSLQSFAKGTVLSKIYYFTEGRSAYVSTAGYATFVNSDKDLDFTETTIKAYQVKVTSKGVATMTQVDNVPAGTPVLLYKDGGATEGIPVMTGAAAVSDNDLVAGTGAAVATTDGDYTNMILNNVGGNVGFYLANDQTVATNRAYLHFATTLRPDPSAPMMLVFDNEVTGINEVKGSGVKVNGYYDLQGRKVAQPTKGLYIVNGKKVVIK